MRLSLYRCRRSRGLRIMAALACLMLVLTSTPVMAFGMLMPMPGADAAATPASMQMPSQHMANGQMAACCQGQGGQVGTTVCHCPVMCGSMLSSIPAAGIASGQVAVGHVRLTGVQIPSPLPPSLLRPPIA